MIWRAETLSFSNSWALLNSWTMFCVSRRCSAVNESISFWWTFANRSSLFLKIKCQLSSIKSIFHRTLKRSHKRLYIKFPPTNILSFPPQTCTKFFLINTPSFPPPANHVFVTLCDYLPLFLCLISLVPLLQSRVVAV